MSCIYSDWHGKCSLFENDEHYSFNENGLCISGYGFDSKGYCYAEDDPDPSYSCMDYEENR